MEASDLYSPLSGSIRPGIRRFERKAKMSDRAEMLPNDSQHPGNSRPRGGKGAEVITNSLGVERENKDRELNDLFKRFQNRIAELVAKLERFEAIQTKAIQGGCGCMCCRDLRRAVKECR